MNKLDGVAEYIEEIRKLDGITGLGRKRLPEISSQVYPGGEIAQLVEYQLARTEFGFGAWNELENKQILRMVHEYIRE